MPSKKEYIKQCLRAFGKTLPEDYDSLTEKEILKIYDIASKNNNDTDKAKNIYADNKLSTLNDEIHAFKQVSKVAEDSQNIDNIISNKEAKLDDIKEDLKELFNNFDKTNPTSKMSQNQTENGIAMYANAKGSYESLSFGQRFFAHILPAAIYKPADMLNRLNACKEVVYDKCKLNPNKVEPYVDKLIKNATTLEDPNNENSKKIFDGISYASDYQKTNYVEIEDSLNNEILGLEDDTSFDKQEEYVDFTTNDSIDKEIELPIK